MLSLELKYPIWLLCEITGISRSSYYKYKNRPIKAKDEIDKLIIDIYNKTNKRAGYRTVKYILKNQYNLTVNHKKVLRIMQENELQSIVRKKKWKKPEETIKENILDRNFNASRPNEKFVTDITYIPTRHKMVYLSTVIDLYNNEPVAWHISDCADKNLSIQTVNKLSYKVNLKGAIIHSDQGIHYTNKEYIKLLQNLNVKQSMSRRGNCWDNAKAESFFSHFKCESLYLRKRKLQDVYEVKQLIEEYMDYYINLRPQKKLGGLSPSLYKILYNIPEEII